MNNKKQVYPAAAVKGVPVARRVTVAPKPVQKKVTAKPKLVDVIDMISSKERDVRKEREKSRTEKRSESEKKGSFNARASMEC